MLDVSIKSESRLRVDLAGFFRVSLDGQKERGTTRSLNRERVRLSVLFTFMAIVLF